MGSAKFPPLSIIALAAKATSIGARPHHRISVSGYVVSASPVHKPLRNLDTIYCRPIGQSTCPLQCLPLPVNQRIAISRQLTKTLRPRRVMSQHATQKVPLFDVVLDHVCPLDSFGRQWLSGGTKLKTQYLCLITFLWNLGFYRCFSECETRLIPL